MRLDGEYSPTDPLVPCLTAYLAGQEGFEPTTSGFGDRRSSRWSYWPVFSLLALPMQRVGPTKCTELLKGKPVRRPPFVLGGRVVAPLALGTG